MRKHRQSGVERKIQHWLSEQNIETILDEMILPPVDRELAKLHAKFEREDIAERAACEIIISNELFDSLFYSFEPTWY